MNNHYRAAGMALSQGALTSVGSSSYTTVCSTIAVASGNGIGKQNAMLHHQMIILMLAL